MSASRAPRRGKKLQCDGPWTRGSCPLHGRPSHASRSLPPYPMSVAVSPCIKRLCANWNLREIESNGDWISKDNTPNKNIKDLHKSIGWRAINFGVAAH